MSTAGSRPAYEPDLPDLDALNPAYDFLRELGRGGMAAVHLARRRDTGELVAIKGICRRFAQDEECVQRFEREARTLASLDHPNIVRTIAVESTDSRTLAIVMEYLDGQTLRDELRERGAFGFEEARAILRDIAEALDHAHARGYVHRDVKPENIFLDGTSGRARLADFGIARPMDGDLDLTLSGMSLGTPAYMSPEQIDGAPLDARSDIYSLGVLGWELLAGRKPWAGENLYGILYRQKHENLPSLARLRPDVPQPILRALEGAMRKRTGARWASARAFLDALLGPDERQVVAGSAPVPESSNTVRFRRPDPLGVPDAPAVLWRESPPVAPAPSQPFVPSDPPWELPVLGTDDEEGSSRSVRPPALALAVIMVVMFVLVAAIGERRQGAPAEGSATITMLSMGAADRVGLDPLLLGVADVERAVPELPGLRTRRDSLAACRATGLPQQHACLRALVAPTDERVHGTFASLIAARRVQAGIPEDSPETPELRRMRIMHRAWMIERDVECGTRHPERDGEEWARPQARCLAAMNGERVGELLAELRRNATDRQAGRTAQAQ